MKYVPWVLCVILAVLCAVLVASGFFFGVTKSGKMDEVEQAKIDAEARAIMAIANGRKFKQEKDDALNASATKAGIIAQLDNQLKELQGGAAQAKQQIDRANSSAQIAQTAAAKANSELQVARQMANQVPALKGQIVAYKNLGTPQDIKTKLDRLAKLEGTRATAPKKTNPVASYVEVGTIQSHDLQHDFYVIGVGSDNGVNKGDKFTIFRLGRPIGKIEISRTRPTVSIAVHNKAFPKPPAPFRSGDKVMKIK